MSIKRIRGRVPSAEIFGVYSLKTHALKFHKVSKDGSGKCDAYFTNSNTDEVIGVLFNIDPTEKQDLDHAEGLGYGYEEKDVEVSGRNGEKVKAFTYVATDIDNSLKPYAWYKYHVLAGAKESGLPEEYILKIERVDAIKDPDSNREAKELGIYN